MKNDSNKAVNNPWFWTWIILILIVLSVNGVMVYFAFTSNPGLVTNDYYERGQNYEQNMLQRQLNAPKWAMNISFPQPVVINQTADFYLLKQPLEFDKVEFYAYRPADASADFSKKMTLNENGDYHVSVTFPLIGKWDLLIYAQKGDKNKNQPLTIFVSK